MGIRAFIVVAVVVTSGCELAVLGRQASWGCTYTSEREAMASVDGVSRVRIVAKAGSLHVEGQADAPGVRAFGTACASREADLDGIQLSVDRSGDELVVETRFADGGADSRRLDLTVEVPPDVAVDVDDSSGSVEIQGVASLDLRDGSGSILVERAHGDVRVTDGSGSLTVRQVQGTVTVADDGSGSIVISEVAGDVVIEEDGSGSITVSDVEGDFLVRRDGSGGVRSERIGGRIVTEP